MIKNIKGENMTLTPSISDYIEKKLIHPVERLLDPEDMSTIADVEVGKTSRHHLTSPEVFRAEINLRISEVLLRAESTNQDIFAAIDEVKDQIIRELTSHKKRKFTLMRRGGQKLKALLKGFRRQKS